MSESKELSTLGTRAPMLSRDQVVHNRALVRDVMAGVMKPGIHYGVIPGTGDKPTLLKPGCEVLLSTFRIATTIVVEDLSTEDVIRYRVVVKGMHSPTGIDLGEGIGECSSDEAKYKWRKPTCEQEFDSFEPSRKRIKWISPQGREPVALQQVRTEPADVGNTILKMAKKRAQTDFTLTALAVSDIFSQDMEDLEAELHGVGEDADDKGGNAGAQQGNRGGKPATNKPTEKAAETPTGKDAKGTTEKKGSAGAQAAKAAAQGGATVPVAEWRKRLDVIGYPEVEFAKRFDLGSLDDVALKDVAKVDQELVDIERRQGGPK